MGIFYRRRPDQPWRYRTAETQPNPRVISLIPAERQALSLSIRARKIGTEGYAGRLLSGSVFLNLNLIIC
jgi:hypothetical protein